MNNKESIFLTGVTGALGKDLIKQLLETTEHKLYLLVRRKKRDSHWDRVRKLLASWGYEKELGTRVHVYEGDVTQERLGLSDDDLESLRGQITTFFHIAALTALNGTEEQCYQVNFEGTKNVLNIVWKFRNQGALKKFIYFSTAYTAGSKQVYCAKEDELPEKPAHANYYESSKYDAEKHVRLAMMEGLPTTIFRPSIVVGDSKTGAVAEFNVIYPFMKLFASGIIKTLPTKLENSFNIIPIDFIVDASLAIAFQESSIGKTYHLTSDDPPQIGLLLELKKREYPHFADIEVVEPETFTKESLDPMQQQVYEMLEPYMGYLNGGLTFDTTNTKKALEGTGVSIPKTDYEFLKTITKFAVDAGYLVAP